LALIISNGDTGKNGKKKTKSRSKSKPKKEDKKIV